MSTLVSGSISCHVLTCDGELCRRVYTAHEGHMFTEQGGTVMCVVHWRGIHGGNVCALTVHVHSQSEGGRPCNIACCNLVLPTVTTSDISNSQTCSGDGPPASVMVDHSWSALEDTRHLKQFSNKRAIIIKRATIGHRYQKG